MNISKIFALALALAAAIGVCSASFAQAPPPAATAARPDLPMSVEDFKEMWALFERWKQAVPPASGSLAVVREESTSLPEHTIFRPTSFPARAMPVLAFGNGGCRNTPVEFTAFLTEIASHGYMVIAAGTDDVDFATTDFQKLMPNGKPLQRIEPSVLTEAVDWAQQTNAHSQSPYYKKLDLKKVAYVGQSCGGMQALGASLDPRTTTTVVLNSGLFPANMTPPSNARLPPRMALSQLHAPIAYFIGGPTDVAYKVAEANFEEIEQPLFLANLPVGHTGAYHPHSDLRWSRAVIAWLDWQLKGDTTARKLFVGPRCGLCADPDWTVKSKNMTATR
jgi:hypothetical protein